MASSASVPVLLGRGDLCVGVIGELSPASDPGDFAAEWVAEIDRGLVQG